MTINVVHLGDALTHYSEWETPDTIISDGAYGIGGFDGDPKTPTGLKEWYEPHIKAWSQQSTWQTSLWFWNTEVGWATVHPLLEEYGWKYVQLITWDKGISHIAGNVNSKTIRRFPVVTEVAGLYVRAAQIQRKEGTSSTIQQWLREEWSRSGLPYSKANEACGVKNAASRKWLTNDHNWYMPPYEEFQKLQEYANQHGKPTPVPYFAQPQPLDSEGWAKLRSIWNHQHGMTNVWQVPALRSSERLRNQENKFVHTNQKPLQLMERQILATTNENDVVWEPFGGTCSASYAAQKLNRNSYAAESNKDFHTLSTLRLQKSR